MSFIETLLNKHSDLFQTSTLHPLTNELCKGILPDYKLHTYLVQDLKFFQYSLPLLANALVHCDHEASAIVLGKQIGFLAQSENTYFFNCLEQLREESLEELQAHTRSMLDKPPIIPAVQNYLDLLIYLTHECKSYPELITFIYIMEKVYQGWANYHLKHTPEVQTLAYKHKEWVVLHSGPDFDTWCDFLALEVERVTKNEENKKTSEEIFVKALRLEIEFFDATYDYHD